MRVGGDKEKGDNYCMEVCLIVKEKEKDVEEDNWGCMVRMDEIWR